MDIITSLTLVLTLIASTSYAWGMRGTTIGGEKGAMLPGAIIGLFLSFFSNILIMQEHFYIFSALGAVSMYIGGSMTYGETLGLSMNSKPAENMKKGLFALFLKGFLWFGLFGAIFTTGLNAVCYAYSTFELILIFAITPAAAVAGYFIFNKPLKVNENKFPKIYFSKTRQESWGALTGALAALIVFSIIKSRFEILIFALCCGLFGGFGWILGQLLQIYSIHYAKDSESFLARHLASSDGIDSWKIMECVLGAFGGLGASIGFIICYDKFKLTLFNLEKNNGILPRNSTLSVVLFVLWICLLSADLVHYFIKPPITKKELKKQLKRKQITQEEYSVRRLKAVKAIPPFYKKYQKFTEFAEPVLYAAIPFILICIGSVHSALATSFFILFLVIAQEVALEKTISKKFDLLIKISFGVISLIILLVQSILRFNFGFTGTVLLYTVVYEGLTLLWLVPKTVRKFLKQHNDDIDSFDKILMFKTFCKENKRVLSVHIYFIICIIFTILFII